MIEIKPVLEAREISKTYPGESPVYALKPTSLRFQPGEFTAVIGRSGSGKSTLLRILGTLDKSDTGELIIEGHGVIRLSEAELARFRRRRIGFVHQDYNLFPEYTAWENVIFPIRLDGATEDRAKTEALLDRLGILRCRDRFPHELSGGEQQRVSLARALVTEPAVVLADEPTGNLDAENSSRLAELLRFACDEYRQTIVMVTHDAAMADYADRLLRIRDGVVTE
jgi:putative ABC transport system ATP-binding protein